MLATNRLAGLLQLLLRMCGYTHGKLNIKHWRAGVSVLVCTVLVQLKKREDILAARGSLAAVWHTES